jgi:hypothetical protein
LRRAREKEVLREQGGVETGDDYTDRSPGFKYQF